MFNTMTAFSTNGVEILEFDMLIMSLQVVFRDAGGNKIEPKSGSLSGSVIT